MKKFLVIVSLVFSIYQSSPCPRSHRLQQITHQMSLLCGRIISNDLFSSDYITALELLDRHNDLYDDLCDQCFKYSKRWTYPYILALRRYVGDEECLQEHLRKIL